MSPLNVFRGQQKGRPSGQDQQQAARPGPRQQHAGHPSHHAPAPHMQGAHHGHGLEAPAWPPQQQPDYLEPQFGAPAHPQQPQQRGYGEGYDYLGTPRGNIGGGFGAGGMSHEAPADRYGQQPPHDPFAPQFEPYSPVAQGQRPQPSPHAGFGAPSPSPYAQQPAAHAAPQWPGPAAHPHSGFDANDYAQPHMPAMAPQPHMQAPAHSLGHDPYSAADGQFQDYEPQLSDWHQPEQAAGGFAHDGYQNQGADFGFAEAAGGELDPDYEDDGEDYEYEDEPRRRRPLTILMALAGAIVVGGGMAYGYKSFVGGGPGGNPPVIKSDASPSKTKPADAGGRQFDYADSKIMGRLGGGSGGAVAASSGASAASGMDENGTRKVSTLVVGRDGSIQAPPEPVADAASGASQPVSVPGLSVVNVDGFGHKQPSAAPAMSAVQPPPSKVVVKPPAEPVKPITVAKVNSAGAAKPSSTGSIGDDAEVAPPPARKPKKVASIARDDAAAPSVSNSVATTGSGANGYVAVLASVPRSSSSRIDALKRFADMQQKYGGVLTGKTPDVAEANLGTKGSYHRLVVGPPGSREQAGTLCSQLKSQGYSDCWVAAY